MISYRLIMESSRSQRFHKGRRNRFVIALAVFVTIGSYLWVFGMQNILVLEARHSFRQTPAASMIPIDLHDESVSSVSCEKLSYFNYEFDVPWQDIDTEKVVKSAMVLITFRSGLVLLVSHGSTHDILDTVIDNSGTKPDSFRAIYGDKATQSDYDFLNLALRVTPTSVGMFDSKANVARTLPLLLVKSLIVTGDSGIFNVRSNEFKGFQYGDPKKHPKKIDVALYSSDGVVEFTFRRNDMKALTITQAEINRMISTVRRVDPAVTADR